MATDDTTATFSVVLDDQVSDAAEDAAVSVEELRARMATGEAAVKSMSTAMRKLRGSTDEVKSAKEQLKAKINAEKDAISASQLTLLKAGGSTKKLGEAKKKLSEDTAKLTDKTDTLHASTQSYSQSIGPLNVAIGGLAGAFLVAATASVGLIAAFGKFIITSADAARSANLLREAASGSASNAAALGTQVDALAGKLPTAKAALNELAVSLAKSGLQGQMLVDTFNAVGQASAAMGDEAGGKIKALLERGRISGRMSIGSDKFSEDLRGTGVQRDDVAKVLADKLNISVDKARNALATGRVKLADGADALRKAVEKKFGGINLRKMMSLEVIGQKVHERLAALTSGVNLEPLLKGFSELADLLDDSTVSGSGLKTIATIFGGELVKGFTAGIPLMKQFFKGLVIGALQAIIMLLDLRNGLRKTFGDNETIKGLFTLETALKVGKVAAGTMLVAVAALAAALGAIAATVALVGGTFQWLTDVGLKFGEWIRNVNWGSIGTSIVDGLIGGLKRGASALLGGAKDLANSVKKGFTDTLGIHSPSKVFEGYGENTTAGFQRGVDNSTPAAAKSLDSMANAPAGGKSGGASGGVTVSMPITINVQGGADAGKQLTSPSFIAELTKALEQVLLGAGVPVRT